MSTDDVKNEIQNDIDRKLDSYKQKTLHKQRKSDYDHKKNMECYVHYWNYFNSEDPEWDLIVILKQNLENNPLANQLLKPIVEKLMNNLGKKKYKIPRGAHKSNDLLKYFIYENANIFIHLLPNLIKYHNSNPQRIPTNDFKDVETKIIDFWNDNTETITNEFDFNDNLQNSLKEIKGLSDLIIIKSDETNVYYIFPFSKFGKSTNVKCISSFSSIELASLNGSNIVEREEETVQNPKSIPNEEKTNSSDESNFVEDVKNQEDSVKQLIPEEDNSNLFTKDDKYELNEDGEAVQIPINKDEEKNDNNEHFEDSQPSSTDYDIDPWDYLDQEPYSFELCQEFFF